MPITADVSRSSSSASAQPSSNQPSWPRYAWAVPVVGLALIIGTVVGIGKWQGRMDESRDREPLRVAFMAAQATGTTIGVVTPQVVHEWSSGVGPREKRVMALIRPGNNFLEPLFLSQGASIGLKVDRCYYLAVQPEGDFDAERVESLIELCYLDPYLTPQSMRGRPVIKR